MMVYMGIVDVLERQMFQRFGSIFNGCFTGGNILQKLVQGFIIHLTDSFFEDISVISINIQ